MAGLRSVNPSLEDWEELERKVGYISFLGEFHDNILVKWPRIKLELPPLKPFALKNGDEEPCTAKLKSAHEETATEEKIVLEVETAPQRSISSESSAPESVAPEDITSCEKFRPESSEEINTPEEKSTTERTLTPEYINAPEHTVATEKTVASEETTASEEYAIPEESTSHPEITTHEELTASEEKSEHDEKAGDEKTTAQKNSDLEENVTCQEKTEHGEITFDEKRTTVEKVASDQETAPDPKNTLEEKTTPGEKTAENKRGFETARNMSEVEKTGATARDGEGKLCEEKSRNEEETRGELLLRCNDGNECPEPLPAGRSDVTAASDGSRKRSPSPSPRGRDTPSNVEHEAATMRGERPRLDKDISSREEHTRNPAPATAAASRLKRPIEIDAAEDSYEKEGKLVSAKRIKTKSGERFKEHSSAITVLKSVECRRSLFKLPEPPEPPHDTEDASEKERVPWAAYDRYKSFAHSLPDYGPFNPRRPVQRLQEPASMVTPAHGKFWPVNRLAANSNEVPPQSKPSTSKAFDFHGESYLRPDHNLNKKQKVRGEWEGDGISSKEIIDLDSQALRSKSNRESSVARSGYSAYTGLGSEKPVQEYDYVESIVDPRKYSRNRKLSNDEQESTVPSESQTEKARGSSRFSNPESSRATVVRLDESQTLNGEDPNDPISDAEKKAVKKADRNPSKSHPEVVLPGYRSTSRRRSTGHSKFKPNVARANAERERRRHLAQTPVADYEDSVDDLSAEHYKAPPGSPDKRNRTRHLSAATKMNADRAQTIPDSSDEEITKLEKGNIKPTAFLASQKVNPKEKKLRQAKYEVLQVFSPAHTWFLGGSKKRWSLFHDRDNGLLSIEGEDTPPLRMAVNPISKIEYSQDNSKMVIHKSRDNSFGGATIVCITLGSPTESKALTLQIALSPTIRSILKPRDYIEKVFATTRKSAEGPIQRPPAREEPDDVRLAKAKARARMDMAQEEKRSARGPRIIDQMANVDEDSQEQTRGTAGLKKARTSLDENRSTETSESSNRKLTAAEFYNKSFSPPLEGNYHETRSSARPADKSPPSRPGKDSVELAWTATHPDWKNSWKSSIMYPPKGKIKVTVNEEDIERLDDGNYLNDTLIEFYIRWLERHLLQDKPDISRRIYFLNTFFYERLTTNSKGKRGFNYDAVRRWTSKIDLLSYDYIVVPVNENAHWYVAIICNAPKLLASNPEVLEISESQGEGAVVDDIKEIGDKLATKKSDVKSPDHVHTAATSTSIGDKLNREATSEPTVVTSDVVEAPAPKSTPTRKGKRKSHVPPPRKYNPDDLRIITLDSLGLKHSPTCTNLKEYLVAEIKSKHGIDIPPPGSIGMTATNIPQQDNFWDCGLFLLSYIEKFLERPDEFIQGLLQNNLDNVTEWPKAVDMRNKIRDILFSLQEGGMNMSKSLQPWKGDKAGPSVTTTSVSKCDSPADTTEDSDESNPEVVGTEQLSSQLLNRDNKKRCTTEDKHDPDGKPAEESIIPQEPTKEDGNKSLRDRRPTPYPTSPNPNDLDEDDTHGSRGAPMQEAGQSDDEMLFSNEHPTKSSPKTPSPKLLSDPSFLSSSVSSPITPKQYGKRIPSSPSSPRTHKSPTAATSGKDTNPRAYPVDAADQAIVGKEGKKKTHTYFID